MNSSSPTVSSDIPTISSGLAPMRRTAREARTEQVASRAVIGRNARPAWIGVYPSTCWRYRLTKNHMPNTAAPSSSTITFEALNVRERKIPSGISGAFATQPSIHTNSPSTARPPAITASVDADPHPVVSVRTIPNTSSDRPTVAVNAPIRSKSRMLPRAARPSRM